MFSDQSCETMYRTLCFLFLLSVLNMCDLSRDNVPNAERNDKRMGDKRLGKPFETGTINGWTAN